jgi:TATA-binding protein-associated factor
MRHQDISAMGRLIGIPHFLSEASVEEEKDDAAATRRAKKMDDEGQSLKIVEIEAVRRMQKHFLGSILRRTVDSRNWLGSGILDVPPHKTILGVLTLTDREMSIINERAEAAKARYVTYSQRTPVIYIHLSLV